MLRRIGLFLAYFITCVTVALLALIGAMCLIQHAHAADQIPCWKAQAVLAWAFGNEAKAEKLARKYGYSKAQISEVRERCGL